ncbi:hypothetical protein G7092_19865 [Mucilaginibacter sp. HC2]|uniref:hypothetical protein n=1 Tax=Mucilaginibacter inviolabilis TaxID=2714892 RepID=UPI00140C1A21|nr:hypothetical protein [Mucilaginibacter inviolabilis]NHA06077.1 hypothetical protein [Mucilaginibacter inviolabilis]
MIPEPSIPITQTSKIYNERAIWAGTFIGGPLAGGYLIAENFKAFNKKTEARNTWIFAILATIVIFGGVFLIPNAEKIPRQIIPIIYTAIAYSLVKRYQGSDINAHISTGGPIFNWWRTIGVSLVGLLITIIPVFGIAYFSYSSPGAGADSKTYGTMKHEVAFDKSNITESEVDKLADALRKTTFFDDAVTKYVYAKKVGKNYELSIPCDIAVTTNPTALAPFIQLRKDMQDLFPDNKIIFNIVVDNLDHVVKRLE